MCKFCNISKLDECETIVCKNRPIEHGHVTVGIEQLSVDIRRNDDSKRWTLVFERSFGDVRGENWNDRFIRIGIKYCPFCGDKLADRFNEE